MELRKDYFLERYVLVGSNRGARPHDFKEEKSSKKSVDFFAPGNENNTPQEIGRLGNKKWSMRWFENKFPAVKPSGEYKLKKNDISKYSFGYGYHEIIVETPSSVNQIWDHSENRIVDLLKVYRDRVNDLESKKEINYAFVFKNHGKEAGASLKHSHSQIIATHVIPTEVSQRVKNAKKYGKIIAKESKSKRKCFSNKSCVAFVPFAARFNHEIWVFPKTHKKTLNDFSESELKDFASILYKIFKKLKKLNAPFNYYLYHAPKGKNMWFHIEITPRLQNWAGYELGSGFVINNVQPEESAKYYRK